MFPAARTSPVQLASPYAHAGSYMRMHRACHVHGHGQGHMCYACMHGRAQRGPLKAYPGGPWAVAGAGGAYRAPPGWPGKATRSLD